MTKLSQEIIKETLEAYRAAGFVKSNAARNLGIPINTFKARLETASRSEWAEHGNDIVPEGQKLRGLSTLYNNRGEAIAQWIKTSADDERQRQLIQQAIESLKSEIKPASPVKFKGNADSDLCSVYVITDYHMGMMASAKESGETWTTQKSVDFLVNWFSHALEKAPDSDTAVLCQLGDFLHFDGLDAVTPAHKNLLDTDTRYCELVNIAIVALRQIIEMMLKKHKHVHIIMAEGNHDMASSVWLRGLFAEKYRNESRVFVDNSHLPFYAFEWGNTMLGFHHGHKAKVEEISKIMTGMYREIYGRTKYAYTHQGHQHHAKLQEDNLMIVEQHPTIAPKDAYSARLGHRANRGASVITYSKLHGEVERFTVRPEMVK